MRLNSANVVTAGFAIGKDTLKEAFVKDPNFKVAIDQLQYGKVRPMVPGYKELQEVLMTEIQRVILGQATPDEALQAATDKANKLLRNDGRQAGRGE